MGKFDKILIVSDFDGTFYSKNEEAWDKNLEAVRYFEKEGGHFTIATGRDYNSLKTRFPFVEEIANAPLLMSNGAKLYDFNKKEYIVDEHLNMEKFAEFSRIVSEKYSDIGLRFSYDDGMIVPDFNEIMKNDLPEDFYDMVKIMPLDDIKKEKSISKCVIVHTPEILEDVMNIGKAFDTANDFYFTKSYPRGLEAVNNNSSKGKTAKKLKSYLGLENGLMFAIGDYDNDLDMIASADFGAAPANALEHIKSAAKIIVADCNDGAVADLIEKIGAGNYSGLNK